jgi:hypothetical protein
MTIAWGVVPFKAFSICFLEMTLSSLPNDSGATVMTSARKKNCFNALFTE